MTWTETEWLAFCGLLEEGWPGEFDDEAAASWRTLLDDTPPVAAVGALRRLLLEGRRFRPSVSEMLAAVRRDPSCPTFAEAYQLMFGRSGALNARPVREKPGPMLYASEAARLKLLDEAITERAQALHPLVASFIGRQGIRRLQSLRLDDPDWGDKVRRDLEQAWEKHVEATDGREVAALAAGTGSDGLRQMDPLAALQPPAVRELEEGDQL